ncbi:hypothetical protein [Salarchaeum sp. JOR-1]|nr:hypothetical protein [Salarchaeum sp. JOR-1]
MGSTDDCCEREDGLDARTQRRAVRGRYAAIASDFSAAASIIARKPA